VDYTHERADKKILRICIFLGSGTENWGGLIWGVIETRQNGKHNNAS